MPKKIEPVMGIPAREYLERMKEDTEVDYRTLADSGGKLDWGNSSEGLRLPYEGRGPDEVDSHLVRALKLVNRDACMNEDQVAWVRSQLLAGYEDNRSDDADQWAPAINSFRLECRDCLRKDCKMRDPESPIARADLERKSIEEVGFSVRTLNALRDSWVKTVGDLCKFNEHDLYRLPHVGFRSLKEVKKFLTEHGLELQNLDSGRDVQRIVKMAKFFSNLSNDTKIALKSMGITSAEDLKSYSELESMFLKTDQLGQKGLRELKEAMIIAGLEPVIADEVKNVKDLLIGKERIISILAKGGIVEVSDLLKRSWIDLQKLKGMGPLSLRYIGRSLAVRGMKLRND